MFDDMRRVLGKAHEYVLLPQFLQVLIQYFGEPEARRSAPMAAKPKALVCPLVQAANERDKVALDRNALYLKAVSKCV